MRSAPAIGGATVEKPGTNLATTSDGKPQRTKRDSACDTQDVGLIESLHRPVSTRYPNSRPAWYQTQMRQRVIDECLVPYLHDRRDAWQQAPDGSYARIDDPDGPSAQQALMKRFGGS